MEEDPLWTSAGWREDPEGKHHYRWYNGYDWDDQVVDDGTWDVDPRGESSFDRAVAETVEELPQWMRSAGRRVRRVSPERRAALAEVDAARSTFDEKRTAYREGVRRAMLTVQSARQPQPIAQIGGHLAVYPWHVVTPNGAFPLTPSIRATVESDGNMHTVVSSTANMFFAELRFGQPGLVVDRQTHTIDARGLYLMIDGGTWFATYDCDPNMGAQVRHFAMALNVTARNVASVPDQASTIQAAESTLAAARADYGDAARAYAALKRLDAANAPDPD
jgi:hypothetical protein